VGKILPRPGIAPPFSNKATATIYIFKKICMHSMYVYKVWANKYNEWMNKRELHKLTHLPKVIKLAPKCLLLLIIDLHILEGNLNSLESLNPYVLVSSFSRIKFPLRIWKVQAKLKRKLDLYRQIPKSTYNWKIWELFLQKHEKIIRKIILAL